MRPQARPLLAAVLALASLRCGGPVPTGPGTPPPAGPQFASHASAHFTFQHTAMDAASIAAIAAEVEGHHERITADLGVASMPTVTVVLYPDRATLHEAVRPIVGPVPAFAAGLVTGVDRIHVVSPNAAAVWPYEAGVQAVVHEFAHCVSLRLNPGIANNPRWLWEAVALWESGQRVDPGQLAYLRAGTPPTLSELNQIQDTRVYEVGALIAEYVVATGGQAALVELVRTNGDTVRVLGLDAAAFTQQWFAFVRARYAL